MAKRADSPRSVEQTGETDTDRILEERVDTVKTEADEMVEIAQSKGEKSQSSKEAIRSRSPYPARTQTDEQEKMTVSVTPMSSVKGDSETEDAAEEGESVTEKSNDDTLLERVIKMMV